MGRLILFFSGDRKGRPYDNVLGFLQGRFTKRPPWECGPSD